MLARQVRSVSKKFFVFPPHFHLGATSPARLVITLLLKEHDNNLPPNLRTANFPVKTVKYHPDRLAQASTVLQTRRSVPPRQPRRQPVSASQTAQAPAPQQQPSSMQGIHSQNSDVAAPEVQFGQMAWMEIQWTKMGSEYSILGDYCLFEGCGLNVTYFYIELCISWVTLRFHVKNIKD